MKKMRFELPVKIIRGGTSKGVYIREEDLPKNREEWDAILLRLMGSPDKKQIDGLGPHMYKIHSFDESFNVPSVKDRTRLTACILASM